MREDDGGNMGVFTSITVKTLQDQGSVHFTACPVSPFDEFYLILQPVKPGLTCEFGSASENLVSSVSERNGISTGR